MWEALVHGVLEMGVSEMWGAEMREIGQACVSEDCRNVSEEQRWFRLGSRKFFCRCEVCGGGGVW